jgi:hypothetical protein
MLSPHVQSAELNEATKSKLGDFSFELTECYAYYSTVSNCAAHSKAPDVAAKSDTAAQNLMPMIYQTGTMAGLIKEALLGRIQLAMDSIKSDIKNDCINISAIYAKHGQSCKALSEHPDARLKALLQ